jgi:hypothetical protein
MSDHVNDPGTFYIIQPGDSVSRVFMRMHGLSAAEFRTLMPSIKINNPHIKNLDVIRPGQVLNIGAYTMAPPINYASDLIQLEREVARIRPDEKPLIEQQPHVLLTISQILWSTGVNVTDASANTIGNLVKNYARTVEKYGAELATAYKTGAKGTLKTELMNQVLNKRPVLDALNKLPKLMQEKIASNAKLFKLPATLKGGVIEKEVRNIIRLAPKSLSTYNPFSESLKQYTKVIRSASKVGGITTWAIPTAEGIYDSYQAYGTDKFGNTVAKSSGKVLGGAAGTALGYAACNLVFGVPSAGTSLFWCGIVAGAAGGMLLSAGGGEVAGRLYDSATTNHVGGHPVMSNVEMNQLLHMEQCRIPQLGR